MACRRFIAHGEPMRGNLLLILGVLAAIGASSQAADYSSSRIVVPSAVPAAGTEASGGAFCDQGANSELNNGRLVEWLSTPRTGNDCESSAVGAIFYDIGCESGLAGTVYNPHTTGPFS